MSNQQDSERRIFLRNLKTVLNFEAGRKVFEHLLKEFDVLGSPPPLMKPEQLVEEVAFRRFGGSLVEYIAEADPTTLGLIMINLAKGKYDEIPDENQDEPEY